MGTTAGRKQPSVKGSSLGLTLIYLQLLQANDADVCSSDGFCQPNDLDLQLAKTTYLGRYTVPLSYLQSNIPGDNGLHFPG